MAKRSDEDDLLDRVISAAQGGGGRSQLYRWMQKHHARLAEAFDRPDWDAVAQELAKAGMTDAHGKSPSATTVRQTWWKVKRDKDATIPKPSRRGKAAPTPATAAVEPPPPAAPEPTGPSGQGTDPMAELRRQVNERSGRKT
jgi:hypothetical protein